MGGSDNMNMTFNYDGQTESEAMFEGIIHAIYNALNSDEDTYWPEVEINEYKAFKDTVLPLSNEQKLHLIVYSLKKKYEWEQGPESELGFRSSQVLRGIAFNLLQPEMEYDDRGMEMLLNALSIYSTDFWQDRNWGLPYKEAISICEKIYESRPLPDGVKTQLQGLKAKLNTTSTWEDEDKTDISKKIDGIIASA